MFSRLGLLSIAASSFVLFPSAAWASETLRSACAWHIVPSPNAPVSDVLHAVSAVSANDAWALGGYSTNGHGRFGLFEHWNGSAWSVVSVKIENPSELFDVLAIS